MQGFYRTWPWVRRACQETDDRWPVGRDHVACTPRSARIKDARRHVRGLLAREVDGGTGRLLHLMTGGTGGCYG
jgi:hypothetical protein